MPRKRRDPHVVILDYFRTADLAQAELMLSLAKEAVQQRQPAKTASVRRGRKAAPMAVAPGVPTVREA